MAEPRKNAGHESRLWPTLKTDVGRVTTDVMKRGVGRQVGATFTELEAFYLDDETRLHLSKMKPVKRSFRRVMWLLKSLFMKLTPARRVLLALSVGLIAFGNTRWDLGNVHLDLRFSFVGYVLALVVLMLELKDKLVARNELEAGRAVQFALMPERSPVVPGWDLWLYTRPANDVGGDLIDHLQIDGRRHGVALGDVAGKALPAALLAVKLQATLRALIPLFVNLDDLGAAINRILHRDGLPNRFATLVYLELTTGSSGVRVLNAGHMPPVLVRGTTIDELPRGSMALGLLQDATFSEQHVDLGEGDVLIVFSDGITEAVSAAGDFFGDERLRTAIQTTTGQPVEAIGLEVLRVLDEFVGDAPPHDDISLVIVRRQTSADANNRL